MWGAIKPWTIHFTTHNATPNHRTIFELLTHLHVSQALHFLFGSSGIVQHPDWKIKHWTLDFSYFYSILEFGFIQHLFLFNPLTKNQICFYLGDSARCHNIQSFIDGQSWIPFSFEQEYTHSNWSHVRKSLRYFWLINFGYEIFLIIHDIKIKILF